MLLGGRCFRFVVNCRRFFWVQPTIRRHLRPNSCLANIKYDGLPITETNTDLSLSRSQNNNLSVQRRCRTSIRMAVSNLAQDLLNLSQFLHTAEAERQQLFNRKSNLQRSYTCADDRDVKTRLLDEIKSLDNSIKELDRDVLRARQRQIPAFGFYIRLKRLHGRLPNPEPRLHDSADEDVALIRMSNATLAAILSLPAPTILEDLANYLLTTSLPITESSFLLMIHRLSSLRFASAARSAYHGLIAAGYAPTSPVAISLLLKLTTAICDRREFNRLQALLIQSDVSIDAYIYTGLVIGNLKLGNHRKAAQWFRDMTANNVEPSLQVLTGLLHDCGSRRDWQLGKEVWRALKDGHANAKLHIDAWAYKKMWRLCRRCEQRHATGELLKSALKDGIELEDVIQPQRTKYKSPPIRNTNKSPKLEDVQESMIKRDTRIAIGLSADKVERGTIQRKQVELRDACGDHYCISGIESRSFRDLLLTRARKRLDKLKINRTWKLRENLTRLAAAGQPELAMPLTAINHDGNKTRSYAIDDEHLSDVIEEESESVLSTWFLSSTSNNSAEAAQCASRRSGFSKSKPSPIYLRRPRKKGRGDPKVFRSFVVSLKKTACNCMRNTVQ
jgi:hypothetical protein